MEEYIKKDGKQLRLGYTTGSCAAAAAKAAAWMLLTGKKKEQISITTPKGIPLNLDVQEITMEERKVSCAIRKDSGDDPDVTNQTLIFAAVSYADVPGIFIDGGFGIGRVTKRGLDQPVGNAAINSVPRQMDDIQKARASENYTKLLADVIAASVDADLLVLDEIVSACNHGTVAEVAVTDFLRSKPENLEVVLTGRNPSEALLSLADYVTEMRKIKHPYDWGITARKGIEF